MGIFIVNLLIVLCFMVPACFFWDYALVKQAKEAASWADKTGVVIIFLIFAVVLVITFITFICVVCGVDVFGAWILFK